MPVILTKHLFEEETDRKRLAYKLLKDIFPGAPPQAIEYELVQQGLLQEGRLLLSLDVWHIIEQQLKTLMLEWEGPDIPIYILPITNGFEKNGMAYRDGICLFISTQLKEQQLKALFTHEYHHMCRRLFVHDPPTLTDSLVMEGLAEDAVQDLFSDDALNKWTKRYSLNEVRSYWDSHIVAALSERGIHAHKPFLYGDKTLSLPPWIGYCTGYRIVQAFKEKCGPFTIKELLQINSEEIVDGAGFRRY
ncbi:MAG: DUF2268 domain-containing putative Zn-dependent protease [Lysinibacillus sp.]